ncbi:Response regulator receiver domain-containing protein [Dyadobacter koreensis]|uniref:Response regulator receiver domain-containing protein n=1 Tax=Dyadobacter koreensis TaxID=408657 RepID=A0A1H6QBW3_9BACT|nr:response regulator [Dyadobacter koreensis]SEI37687.1 Response regulator receiver domain-containing protein [Dyadobacter koreensis]
MKIEKIIYIVEDDIDDMLLISEAVKSVDRDIKIISCENGAELIEKIELTPGDQPSLILLDMNMPKMNGMETLQYIRSSRCFDHIPVVMLSTTNDFTLIESAYRAGVNTFYTKPIHYQDLKSIARELTSFFINGQYQTTED